MSARPASAVHRPTFVDVEQDGADFYDEAGPIWTAPVKVGDFDLQAARQARRMFEAWAESQGHTYEFREM